MREKIFNFETFLESKKEECCKKCGKKGCKGECEECCKKCGKKGCKGECEEK